MRSRDGERRPGLGGAAAQAAPVAAPPAGPTFTVDKTSLNNGGVITVTGQAAPGKPVYIEVFNENPVTGSFFDSRKNKETGKIPYKLYLADEIFFTGTAAEVTPVRSVDRKPVGEGKRGPITQAIQAKFFGIVEGELPDKWGWLTPVTM